MNGFVFYDLETTGSDASGCKIVEMCFASVDGILLDTIVNPGRPIPKQASDIHHITGEIVRGALLFADFGAEVQAIVDEATVMVGYNNFAFDSLVLNRELQDAGFPGFSKDSHGIITQAEADLFSLWKVQERRNLVTAAKRFASMDIEDSAHSASVDTTVLPDILLGMMREWGLDGQSVVTLSREPGSVDREGKFSMSEDGIILFNFGKFRGKPISTEEGRGYMKWMISTEFSPEVKAWCRRFLDR